MDLLDFSEDEILAELSRLGYNSVPTDKLRWFKQELENMVSSDVSMGNKDSSAEVAGFMDDSTSVDDQQGHQGIRYDKPQNVCHVVRDTAQLDTNRTNTHCAESNTIRKQENYIQISKPSRRLPHPELVELSPFHGSNPLPGSDPLPSLGDEYKFDNVSRGNWQSVRTARVAESLDTSVASTASGHNTSSVSEYDSDGRRQVRRKTLRKTDTGSRVIDESISAESEPGSLACLQDRLAELGIYDGDNDGDDNDDVNKRSIRQNGSATNPTSRTGSRPRRPWTSQDDDPYRLRPDFSNHTPSVILHATDHAQVTNRLRRSDPVKRYEQYQHTWTAQRTAGTREEKRLRWAVKEHMMHHDDVTAGRKPQKVYVANSYVAPTDKKRQALRWRVRMDMAQGHIPT